MSELPNGWTRATLDAIADVRDFEREPINSSDRESRISGKSASELYPYYGATGQVGLIDSYRSEGQRVLLGEDAAPFLDPVKEKAYLANGRFWVNNHAHVLAGAAGLIDNRFLCHQLNTVDYHPFVTGSTRLKLTSAAMKQIPLVIAPAAEQTRIVEKLEELLSDLDAGVAELKAAQKRLGQYRQSLLKAAVEGAKKSPLSPNPSPARGEGSRGLTHGSSHAKGEGSGSLVPGSSHASGLRRRNRYPSPPPARERCLCSLGVSRANARRPVSCPPSPRGRGVGGEGASQPATEDDAWLQARVRELRQQQTPEEHALWQQLRAKRFAGYKFRRQQLLGRFIVDFVCFAQRLIVELDGGQHAEAAEYDSRRDAWLKQQGFRVLRFWNNDWSAQREAVLEAIWQALQQEPLSPTPPPQGGRG